MTYAHEVINAHDLAHDSERQDMIAFLVAQGMLLLGHRVLDVGCGEGDWTGRLLSRGAIPIGVEPVREPAITARSKYPGVEIYIGTVKELPRDLLVDGMICMNVMQFVPNPVSEIRRWLPKVKEGGYVVLKDMDFNWFEVRGRGLDRRLLETVLRNRQCHEQTLTGRQCEDTWVGGRLCSFLQQAGLKDVVSKGFLIERSGPLTGPDRTYVQSIARWLVRDQHKLSNETIEQWLALFENGPSCILDSPDFYYREGEVLAYGRKQAR